MLITTYEDLVAFCTRAKTSNLLAIDTEFLREKTYYAKLCLIQLATDSEIVLVDPLCVTNLRPLTSLFLNENITKIVHSGSQDFEIIYHELGCIPRPVFDTQIAASVMGYGQQAGYALLVHGLCGVQLPKTESYSDWSKRPLTAAQISYAEEDVLYLPRMYEKMKAELERQGRLGWLDSEFADLIDENHYLVDDRSMYLRVKRVGHLTRRQLSAARELTAWRESTARKRNIPRKWVLADEQIIEASRREPKTIDDLFQVRGIREKLSTADAREAVAVIQHGINLPESELPDLGRPAKNEISVETQVDLMSVLVHQRAKENNIAPQLLAPRDELEELARYSNDTCTLMKGWKRQIIGQELFDLLKGRLALSLEGAHLQVRQVDKDSGDFQSN